MQDKRGCKAKTFLPRIQAPFSNKVLVELPIAKHFIQEDEPRELPTPSPPDSSTAPHRMSQ
jgi:hypothetical protein